MIKPRSPHVDAVPLDANASRPASPAAWEAYAQATAQISEGDDPQARARQARRTLEAARASIAQSVGACPDEIVFTSGGTEAAAWAVAGAMHAHPEGHVVTSALEHPAVSRTAAMVAKAQSYTWTQVACARSGKMDLEAIFEACQAPPAVLSARSGASMRLVSLIAASNETGVLQPVAELAAWCRERQILCHTDAVQAIGRKDVDLRAWQVDLASWAGHKVGAVGAIGCLYVRRGVVLQPPWLPWNPHGANVQALEDPEISVAAAAALAAALQQRSAEAEAKLQARRDHFERVLAAQVPNFEIIGGAASRLGHTSCVRFEGCEADGLMMALDLEGFYCSTGSACSSGSIEPSPILLGMGYKPKEAREALRFSFDDAITDAGLKRLLERLVALVQRMRA